MKKPLKVIVLTLLLCFVLVTIAGVIKFNFIDVPYLGEPITYISSNGESATAHFKVDNSVEVSSHDFETVLLHQSPSASGSRYSNSDESFVFWTKGKSATILQNDTIIFRGTQENTTSNVLSGSIWKYTGSTLAGQQHPLVSDTEITLNFDNNRIFGEAGCNSFFGSYTYTQQQPRHITFADLGSSMALCDEKLMAQEDLFLKALSNTHSLSIDEQRLSLHFKQDSSLHFKLFGSLQ